MRNVFYAKRYGPNEICTMPLNQQPSNRTYPEAASGKLLADWLTAASCTDIVLNTDCTNIDIDTDGNCTDIDNPVTLHCIGI